MTILAASIAFCGLSLTIPYNKLELHNLKSLHTGKVVGSPTFVTCLRFCCEIRARGSRRVGINSRIVGGAGTLRTRIWTYPRNMPNSTTPVATIISHCGCTRSNCRAIRLYMTYILTVITLLAVRRPRRGTCVRFVSRLLAVVTESLIFRTSRCKMPHISALVTRSS